MGEFDLLDTLLNLSAFTFIGILIWMYRRPLPQDEDDSADVAAPNDDE